MCQLCQQYTQNHTLLLDWLVTAVEVWLVGLWAWQAQDLEQEPLEQE